jgi:hypothetical protein
MYSNYSNHDRLRKKHGRLRPSTMKIRSFTTVYGESMVVYDLCFSPYTFTEIYDRNTGPCNTEKIRSYTERIWYVYGRIRPYTEFVTVDLGMYVFLDGDKIVCLYCTRNDFYFNVSNFSIDHVFFAMLSCK